MINGTVQNFDKRDTKMISGQISAYLGLDMHLSKKVWMSTTLKHFSSVFTSYNQSAYNWYINTAATYAIVYSILFIF